jgi:SAM-dependent methyltransferase
MTSGSAAALLGKLHGQLVHKRRVAVLARLFSAFLPTQCRLLDIGCGDGVLDALLQQLEPTIEVQGAEFSVRPNCAIPCRPFDGVHLPFGDNSFDGCLFVDVLHHMLDPRPLLEDACRVSRNFLLIKDHLAQNSFDRCVLRVMDWIGNRPHGVMLPYAYLSDLQWNRLYGQLGLEVARIERDLGLYPSPLSALFGRKLHFVALLKKQCCQRNK